MKGTIILLTVLALGTAMIAVPLDGYAAAPGGKTPDSACAKVKQLIDKVATVILNDPSDEAFDETVKNLLRDFCAMRAQAAGTPSALPMVEELTAAVLGWAWDASSVMKFKAQRNASAADIAARSMKRQITRIQTVCPAIVVPDITALP